MSDTNPSNGAAGPVVETFESLYATPQAQEAPPEAEAAQTPDEPHDTDSQHDGTNEGDADTSAASGDEGTNPVEKAKSGTPKGVQKRLDELTKQREEYRRQVEAQTRIIEDLTRQRGRDDGQAEATPADPSQPPNPDGYADGTLDPQYLRDLARFEVRQELEAERRQAAIEAQAASVREREQAARAKYADYDEVVTAESFAPLLDGNPGIIPLLAEHEMGPEIGYYLGKHPEEMAAIAKLDPVKAAGKLERIAIKLETPAKPEKPVSKAPPPPGQIGGGNPPVSDPTQYGTDRMDDYVTAVRQRYIAQGKRPPY